MAGTAFYVSRLIRSDTENSIGEDAAEGDARSVPCEDQEGGQGEAVRNSRRAT